MRPKFPCDSANNDFDPCTPTSIAQASFVILVEDDILLAKDALTYFEWAREEYQSDKSIFTVSAYGDIGVTPALTLALSMHTFSQLHKSTTALLA